MALNAENVLVAVTGAVYVGATTTPLPTTSVASLNAGFKDLGYLGEDGFTEGLDVDSDEITAWQNGTVVRRTITKQSKTFELNLIETKQSVLEFVRPGSTLAGTSGAYSMAVKAITAARKALVFDILDGDVHLRKVVPNCEITDFGEVEYKNGQAIGYTVTVTAYPDDTDTVMYEYSDATNWAS
jgi:hypothetical protein